MVRYYLDTHIKNYPLSVESKELYKKAAIDKEWNRISAFGVTRDKIQATAVDESQETDYYLNEMIESVGYDSEFCLSQPYLIVDISSVEQQNKKINATYLVSGKKDSINALILHAK